MEQFMCCILTFGDVYSALRLPSVAPSEDGMQGSCSEVMLCSAQIEVVDNTARRIETSEQCVWIISCQPVRKSWNCATRVDRNERDIG
jgi:hypothetical protein